MAATSNTTTRRAAFNDTAAIDARLRRIELLMVDLVASTSGLGPGAGAHMSPTGAMTRARQTALEILKEHQEPAFETRAA